MAQLCSVHQTARRQGRVRRSLPDIAVGAPRIVRLAWREPPACAPANELRQRLLLRI